MDLQVWQLLFWLISGIFSVSILIIMSFWKAFLSRIDQNFKTLFDKIDQLTKREDFDKLNLKVSNLKDRVTEIEIKIKNCKNCSS